MARSISRPASFHVAWSGRGCWQLRRTGAKRAMRLSSNFYELMREAKRRAEPLGAKVYLHLRDGHILARIDYAAGALPGDWKAFVV